MAHTLPPLGYAHDALEPFIDAATMQIHHGKHHQAYVDNLNKALEAHVALSGKPVEALIKDLAHVPDDIRTAVRNNGGGHWNHSFFWKLLKKNVAPTGPLVDAIVAQWGSLDAFKEAFEKAALARFGSGWVWLVRDGKELKIVSTGNQDSPLMGNEIAQANGTPLIALDVWEHAYYIKYQNRRAEYVRAFWNVLDWHEAGQRFAHSPA